MSQRVEHLQLLFEISRELTSTHDLTTLLRRILQHAIRTTKAESGAILLLDAGGQPVDGVLIYADQVYEDALSKLRPTYEKGVAGWVAKHRQGVLIPDTRKDDRWETRPDDDPHRRGGKSAIAVPLIAQEQLVGVLTITRALPQTFASQDMELMQAISDQAAIAVLNARLIAETQRRNRLLTALVESALVIGQPLHTHNVLDRILSQVKKALNVEAVSLALLDKAKKNLVFEAATGLGARQVIGMKVPLGVGVAGWVAEHKQAVIVPQTATDRRFFSGIDQTIGFETRSIACAPMIAEREVIGVVEAINPIEGAFEEDTLPLLSGLASLAGLAVHRARLFDALSRTEARYRDLFETSIDPILISDWEGFIIDANRKARELLNLPFGQVESTLANLIPLQRDLLGDHFEVLLEGQTVSYEAELRVRDGTRPVEIFVRRIKVEDMDLIQWVLRDISERKELDTLREDLIAMIFHDLRAPLSNVATSLDVIASTLEFQEPSLQSLLQIAQRSVDRIQRLTNSLLDMSRLEAGQPVRNRKPVAPFSLAKEAVEVILPIAQNKNIQVELTVPPELPLVYVDEDMIRRVLINLLENAVKYTPADGEVSVGAAQEGKMIRLWVQDSGPGIPPEAQQSIFDKYSRLRSAEKSGIKGVGLGLAFCKLAVEGHGGQIGVVSTPGKGARFHFTVPVASQEQIREAQQETGEAPPERLPSIRPAGKTQPVKVEPRVMAVQKKRLTGPFTEEPDGVATQGSGPFIVEE